MPTTTVQGMDPAAAPSAVVHPDTSSVVDPLRRSLGSSPAVRHAPRLSGSIHTQIPKCWVRDESLNELLEQAFWQGKAL